MAGPRGCRALVLAVGVTVAGEAPADDAPRGDTCVSAYENAQQARRTGQMLQARGDLKLCLRACPASLARDCARWLPEVEKAIPTVVLSARDAAGAPRSDVAVSFDGAPLVSRIGAQPIEVDPGDHVFGFRDDVTAERVDVRVAVAPGERNRDVSAVFPVSARRDRATPAPDRPPSRQLPVASIVLGGAGLAALAAGGVLAISGHLKRSDIIDSGCAPACDEGDVATVRTQWIAGGVVAGVGLVALGAAGLLWWTAPPSASRPVAVGVTPGGVVVGGRF